MDFVGRYINMDACTGRRAAIEQRLAAAGLADRYTRFAAVDGRALEHPGAAISPGEVGCMASHLRCITEAGARAAPTHIVEDDVVFTSVTATILLQILEAALAEWDILFCDIVVPLHVTTLYGLLRLYRKSGIDPDAPPGAGMPKVMHYLPLESVPFTGAASYVVSPAAARKLAPLIAAHLDDGPSMPVDHLIQTFCASGQITAACTVPFLTSVDPDDVLGTTIAGREQHDLSALAFFLMRNHFFMGRDQDRARRLAGRLTEALKGSEDMGPLIEAVHFALSDKFEIF
jgi:GR25 family glycosyltransferase involved in LPS biosynthesis